MVAPARQISVQVLHRIKRDDAWAGPTLDAELTRSAATRADAALATQIVYGSLRVFPALDETIQRYVQKPGKVDSWTHAALLTGAFQLLHLSRVPARAVVHDTVELVRQKRGKPVAGFANAVLRKVAEERPPNPELPTSLVVPAWLDAALRESIGEARAETLLRVETNTISADLRLREDADPGQVATSILTERPHAHVSRTELSPVGLRVSGGGDLRKLHAYAEGAFAVQEEGAQLVGLLANAKAGERVLDVCAGRGGKTAQLVEAVGLSGHVVASDLHEHRLDQIPQELARLRLDASSVDLACVDWTVGSGKVDGSFDRVIVDAPCTGLGTLRRRPEILLRIGRGDAAQMGEIQLQILERAAAMVRPGGCLVYAVCSPLREEGEAVVQALAHAGFQLANAPHFNLKSLPFGSSAPLDLGPWVPGSGPWADAYQVAMWVYVG